MTTFNLIVIIIYFIIIDNTEPENQTWYINTPLIDSSKLSGISPKIFEETLHYFLISSNRLSQMTKTYDDIEAVTQLLEEVRGLLYSD